MALSRVVSDIFNVEKYCDLEIPLKNQARSLSVVPYDRLGMVSYSNFVPKTKLGYYSTMGFEIFDFKMP